MAIKAVTLQALATQLQTVTGVACFPRQQDEEGEVTYPYLVLLPGQFSFNSWNADEIDNTNDGAHTLVCVGDIEGEIEIRAYSQYAAQREDLEDQINRTFMRNELAPGNLNLTLPSFAIDGVTFPNSLTAAFDLGDAAWHEEMVFTQPRFSAITIDVNFSALIAASYSTITSLQLAFAEDVTATEPEETVEIQDDGTLKPAP